MHDNKTLIMKMPAIQVDGGGHLAAAWRTTPLCGLRMDGFVPESTQPEVLSYTAMLAIS